MSKWVIYSEKETLFGEQPGPMFWNEKNGWGQLAQATIYDPSSWPIVADGLWIELPQHVETPDLVWNELPF
jgi:hypothetical protein